MIKIKSEELRRFIGKAGHIADRTSVVDITRYIKVACDGERVILTKTNLEAFITYEIEAQTSKPATLLINEKEFTKAVQGCRADELKFTWKDRKSATHEQGFVRSVTMEDGKLINTTVDCGDETKFPELPKYNSDEHYTFTPGMVEALYVASTHCLHDKDLKFQNFIHIKNKGKNKGYICGYNNAAMYYKKVDDSVPDMTLDANIAKALKDNLDSGVILYRSEKYDFFDAGTAMFGFIQPELKGPDFEQIVKKMDTDKSFEIDRRELLSYCKYMISIKPMSIPEPIYLMETDNDKAIFLDFVGASSNITNPVYIDVKKNKKYKIPKFVINPEDAVVLLENLTSDTVHLIGPCDRNYYVKIDDDQDYVGALREYNDPRANADPVEEKKSK